MKRKYFTYWFLLLFLSFGFSQNEMYSSSTIDQNLVQGANAVVRLNQQEVIIESQQKMTIEQRRIITVLNEEGNRYVGAGVGYDEYQKIKKIEAVIYDDSGNEIKKIKKKDFIDQSAVDGGTLYSDSRVLYMAYTPINYPYTVEFTYKIETKNTAAIRSWSPIDGYFLAIEEDSYKISDVAALGLRKKHKNVEAYNISVSEQGNSLEYKLKDLKPLKPESLSPSFQDIEPQVMIAAEKFHYYGVDGSASDWKEFGKWVNDALLKGRQEVSSETKAKVLSLVEGVEDPIEKAKLIYDFVQENTRYISVQVGIGGVQPIPALKVDEVKYGDCKGLTNYTQSLLEVAGVESYYTIVEAGRTIVDFEEDFPSLAQGNHIILAIPEGEKLHWLDCTSQKHPFGFIGDFTDNRRVLIIKDGEGQIAHTEKYIDEKNYMLTKADIHLDANGGIQANTIITSKGIDYDNRFFLEDESKKNIEEYYKKYWNDVNDLFIENYDFSNDKEQVVFTEKISLNAKKYASILDNKLIFSTNVLDKNVFIPKRYRNRKFPLIIQRGYVAESDFSIQIPSEYVQQEIPEDIKLESKFGTYNVTYEIKDNAILYKRKLSIKKGEYSKEDYEAYRKFRKKVAKSDKQKIILNKG